MTRLPNIRRTLQPLIAAALLAHVVAGHAQVPSPALPGASAPKAIVKVVGSDGRVLYTDRSVTAGAGRVSEVRPAGVGRTLAINPEQAKQEKQAETDLVSWAKGEQLRIDAAKREVAAKNSELTKKLCGEARQRLAVLSTGGKVVKMNDKNEPVYLTDVEIARQREEATARALELCR